MEGTIGFTTGFAGNFAPKNWAFCNGAVINIASNTALFSILGTTYGGNGTTTFALPDLQGRAVVGAGQGPGLSNYPLGQKTGIPTTTLTINQMPLHIHPAVMQMTSKASDSGVSATPGGGVYATASNGSPAYASAPTTTMQSYPGTLTMANAGGGQPFSSQHPVMAIYYVICMFGIFPSRN